MNIALYCWVLFTYDMIYFFKLHLSWHPVSVVQNTITRKQYTEQHNETEYPE